jgi:hypothetical protein
MILKLKNLYDGVQKQIKTLPETQKYDIILNQLAQNTATVSIIADYKNKLSEQGNAYLLLVDTSASITPTSNNTLNSYIYNENNQPTKIDEKNVITITTFSDYDNIVKSFATPAYPTNINKKLYVIYNAGKVAQIPFAVDSSANKLFFLNSAMDSYKNELINSYKKTGIIGNNVAIPSVYFSNKYDVTTFKADEHLPSTIYTGIDITDFYTKLYKERTSLTQSKTTLSSTINGLINNTIMTTL